jgi:hypothetical protein
VTWGSGFSTRISIVCHDVQSAAAFTQILKILRDSGPAAGQAAPGLSAFLQGLGVSQNASRVELSGSDSLSLLRSINH